MSLSQPYARANNAPLGRHGFFHRILPPCEQISTGPPRGSDGRGGRGGGGVGDLGGRGLGGARGPPRARSLASAESEIRRRKTQMIEDVTKELDRLGLELGDPLMQKMKTPGAYGKDLKVIANLFGVKMAFIPIYRYDVTISANSRKDELPIEFTKRSPDDRVVVDRHNMCRLAFKEFFDKYSEIFGDNPHAFYYDLACILYTLEELKLKSEANKDENTLILGQVDCAKAGNKLSRFGRVRMLIRRVKGKLTLNDLSHLTNDTSQQQNHSLASFVELATSQCALFDPSEHVIIKRGSTFLMNPGYFGFKPEDCPTLSKTKKTPFHNCGINLMEKANEVVFLDQNGQCHQSDIIFLNAQFKTLCVDVCYKDPKDPQKVHKREIRIASVSSNTANSHKFDVSGERVSVAEYYERKYGIKLQYPDAPMAAAMEKGKMNFYPMELCFVQDNQRARLSKGRKYSRTYLNATSLPIRLS